MRLTTLHENYSITYAQSEFGEISPHIGQEAYDLANRTGIHILRNKELHTVARDDRGRVVGACFLALTGDIYSFDIVVEPKLQGQGIGSELLNDVLSDLQNQINDIGGKIEVDVVNPKMERMLLQRGFRITNKVSNHTIMVNEGKIIKKKPQLFNVNIRKISRKDSRKFITDRAPIRNIN